MPFCLNPRHASTRTRRKCILISNSLQLPRTSSTSLRSSPLPFKCLQSLKNLILLTSLANQLLFNVSNSSSIQQDNINRSSRRPFRLQPQCANPSQRQPVSQTNACMYPLCEEFDRCHVNVLTTPTQNQQRL